MMMEFNKTVSNPMLVGAIELMKADDTPEHRKMFIDELVKAEFLSPAIVEPEPTEDAEGQLTIASGSKVQIPMLSTSEGSRFFMAFTDKAEFDKWQEKNPKLPFFALRMEEYASMVLRRDPQGNLCPALGVAVNPFGANILLPREMLASLLTAKLSQMRQMTGGPMDPAWPGKQA